jgi:predicted DNA-binding transcriptional regulator AlpA
MELLRIKDLVKKLHISKSTIYTMINAGEFIKPSKIGKNIVCWNNTDVDAWIIQNTGRFLNK